MKQLETTFTLDNNNFTQVKRNDKAAIYRRETSEGQFVSFEVFAVRSKDDVEIYPSAGAVNKWLYAPISEDRANLWFDRFTNGEVSGFQGLDPITAEPVALENDPSLEEVMATPVSTEEVTEVTTPTVEVEDPTVPEETIPVVNPTPDGGVAVTVATVKDKVVTYNYPVGEFTQAQFANVNGMPERGTVWSVLDKLVKGGKLDKVLKKLGKGRPSQVFTVKS